MSNYLKIFYCHQTKSISYLSHFYLYMRSYLLPLIEWLTLGDIVQINNIYILHKPNQDKSYPFVDGLKMKRTNSAISYSDILTSTRAQIIVDHHKSLEDDNNIVPLAE